MAMKNETNWLIVSTGNTCIGLCVFVFLFCAMAITLCVLALLEWRKRAAKNEALKRSQLRSKLKYDSCLEELRTRNSTDLQHVSPTPSVVEIRNRNNERKKREKSKEPNKESKKKSCFLCNLGICRKKEKDEEKKYSDRPSKTRHRYHHRHHRHHHHHHHDSCKADRHSKCEYRSDTERRTTRNKSDYEKVKKLRTSTSECEKRYRSSKSRRSSKKYD